MLHFFFFVRQGFFSVRMVASVTTTRFLLSVTMPHGTPAAVVIKKKKVVSEFEEMGGTTSTHGSRDQMLYCVVRAIMLALLVILQYYCTVAFFRCWLTVSAAFFFKAA